MMTDDEIEIESWRYSGRAFIVMPLSSGRIAILCPNRQPYRIVDNWELAKSVGASAENFQLQSSLKMKREMTEEMAKIDVELDL